MGILDNLKSIISPKASLKQKASEPEQPVWKGDSFDATSYSSFHQPEFKL